MVNGRHFQTREIGLTGRQRLEWIFSDVFKFPRNLGSLRMYANGVVSELWSIENTALKIVI